MKAVSPRNNVISILKGIGIILMVIGHAEAPELISNFIYTFHMPLFFIASGYFFSTKYLDDPWTFITRRFKGLYIPFLKWAVIYLVLHNLWHAIGILNENYGNWTGGVTHPYSWHEVSVRLVKIVFGMSGYDEFMAGAFWFFRGLLIASIGFLVLYKFLASNKRLSDTTSILLIMTFVIGFNAFRFANGISISIIPNGGLRETWGMFFFAFGVIFRRYESGFKRRWWLPVLCFLFILGAGMLHTSGMNNSGKMIDLLTLPLTGTIGFLMTYWLSGYIDVWGGVLKTALCHIGNNTLYVLIWHIPAYKIVSLMKIHYYGLDPDQIGCHMVIHFNNTDFFWIIYSIVGVAVPLGILWLWRRFRDSRPINLKGAFKWLS